MGNVEIMNLNVVCRNFPDKPVPEIKRDHFLDAIDVIFKSGTQVVFVEGEEGIGKTTLLSQFSRRYSNNSLSLFINTASRPTYTLEYLRLVLAEQLHWALFEERFDDSIDPENYWRTNWSRLQSKARRKNDYYYFVIDGLLELQEDRLLIQEYILKEFCPLGASGFRFVISGNSEQFSEIISNKIQSKSFPLSGFSLSETFAFFDDFS